MAKDRDRSELEHAALREELEAYQEQASQKHAEREWLHKVLKTAEAKLLTSGRTLTKPTGSKSQRMKR